MRINSIILYVYATGSKTATMTLYRRETWKLNVNRAEVSVASDNTFTSMGGSIYKLELSPAHTMMTTMMYRLLVTGITPLTSAIRFMGMELEYETGF